MSRSVKGRSLCGYFRRSRPHLKPALTSRTHENCKESDLGQRLRLIASAFAIDPFVGQDAIPSFVPRDQTPFSRSLVHVD
jgi:hypothetical protein